MTNLRSVSGGRRASAVLNGVQLVLDEAEHLSQLTAEQREDGDADDGDQGDQKAVLDEGSALFTTNETTKHDKLLRE